MIVPTFHVDLDKPPDERWRGIEQHRDAAANLLAYYVRDLGGLDQFGDLLTAYCGAYVPAPYATEMKAIAERLERPEPGGSRRDIVWAIRSRFRPHRAATPGFR